MIKVEVVAIQDEKRIIISDHYNVETVMQAITAAVGEVLDNFQSAKIVEVRAHNPDLYTPIDMY